MTKLLAAVDNSTAAQPVVGTACAVAELFGAKVEVLHVNEDGDDGDDVARAAADAALVPYWRADGEPAERLLVAADDTDVMAIAVAARSSDRGHGPAVGATTRALITQLTKPIVVVPPHEEARARIDRVLVPLDRDRATTDALRRTVQPLARSEVELVVVHVSSPASLPQFCDQIQHETEAWAREFLLRYWPGASPRIQLELRLGEPAAEVTQALTGLAADLVVLVWARSLEYGRAAVVQRVLDQARVPVLLLAVTPEGRVGTPIAS